MKRSARIRLLLMGSTAFSLAACGDDGEQAAIYSTVQECIAGGVYTEQYCRTSFDEALSRHPQVAPRYNARAECEADFGPDRCDYRPVRDSGGSFWMPMMAGFMLGQALDNRPRWSEPLYRPNLEPPPPAAGSPGSSSWGTTSWSYRPGSFRTGSNVEVGYGSGPTSVSRGSIGTTPVRTSTLSRGGFGARAASVGVAS
jgi:uncharacterized protein YgiB involved in biofilm formation